MKQTNGDILQMYLHSSTVISQYK